MRHSRVVLAQPTNELAVFVEFSESPAHAVAGHGSQVTGAPEHVVVEVMTLCHAAFEHDAGRAHLFDQIAHQPIAKDQGLACAMHRLADGDDRRGSNQSAERLVRVGTLRTIRGR